MSKINYVKRLSISRQCDHDDFNFVIFCHNSKVFICGFLLKWRIKVSLYKLG